MLLPNGDFLGDFGDPTHQFPQNQLSDGTWGFNDTGAVFVEVNPAGQVVRTFTFPAGWWAYRVEAVTNPAAISFAQTSVTMPTFTQPVNPTPLANSQPTTTSTTPTPTPPSPTPTPSSTSTPATPSSTPLTHMPTTGLQGKVTIIISSVVAAAATVSLAASYFIRKRANPKNTKQKQA